MEYFDLIMSALVSVSAFFFISALRQIIADFALGLPEDWKNALERSGSFVFGGRLKYNDVFALSMTLGIVVSVFAFAQGWPILVGPLIALSVLGLPLMFVVTGIGRYRAQLEVVFPSALQQVANEMAAGRSLERALEEISKSALKPADAELGALHRKVVALGMERALEDTAKILQVKSFSLAAAVLNVGSKQGGNLVQALKQLSTTLVEIQRLNRKIRTASENGRRVLLILSICSLLFPVFWYAYGPMKFEVVWNHPIGQGLLALAFLIWLIAVGLAIAVMRVKV